MAGSAGSSNAGGAGAGGLAGTGGMSGGAGMGGVGGIPTDAGTDAAVPDGGDAGPVDPRAVIARALCAKYDEVVGCEPSPNCVAEAIADFANTDGEDGSCEATTNAYFECLAADSVDSFSCNGLDPNRPTYNLGANNCPTEEAAWFDSFCGFCPCPT
jgi:hypothetical protein